MLYACTHRALAGLACIAALALWPAHGSAQHGGGSAGLYLDDESAAFADADAAPAADGGGRDATATSQALATSIDIEELHARAANSLFGATGGLHLIDAASGLPGSV